MAHSHEQSLLAKLGFADPDRKDKRHTLACQYLCEPEVARKVLQVTGVMLGEEPLPKPADVEYFFTDEDKRTIRAAYHRDSYQVGMPKRSALWLASVQTQMERVIEKERGFLVGFVDVFIRAMGSCWSASPTPMGSQYSEIGNSWRYAKDDRLLSDIFVEVKAGYSDVADIIKQLDMYRRTVERLHYGVKINCVVATCYPVTATDKATLKAANIHHIYLGDGFKAYCAKRASEKPVEDAGI